MEPAEWIGELVTAIGAMGAAVATVAAGFLGLDASIRAITGQFEGLVRALSPATAATFDRALQNLSATLGQAVVPLFQVLIGAVDKLAGVVSPLAAQLGPIFAELADGLTRPFLDLAHAAVEVGSALAAAFQYLIPIITAAADVIGLVLSAGIAALVQEAMHFAQSLVGTGDALTMVKNAAQEASKQVLLFAARIAAAFGAFGFIDNLVRFIERRDDERGLQAAPQNVRIQDFASIARDMVQASFAAGPGGAQLSEREYLRDILGELKFIRENPQSINQLVEKGFERVIQALVDMVPKPFRTREGRAGEAAADAGRIRQDPVAAWWAANAGIANTLGIRLPF